jgi:predicted phosphohydrolase
MYNFFEANRFETLKILYNNSFLIENKLLCGSRGWFAEESNQKTVGDVSWLKITDRETMRLKMSLESAQVPDDTEKIVFLHFPPVWNNAVCSDIIELLHTHNVTKCYFGHIHGMYSINANFDYEGIRFELISADYLDFCPKKIVF